MKTIAQLAAMESPWFHVRDSGPDGVVCDVCVNEAWLFIIASNGLGWDHVSVSAKGRCAIWDEMNTVKNLFFNPEECVMQLHPAQSQYINCHPFVLHLWRPQNQIVPTPPLGMV